MPELFELGDQPPGRSFRIALGEVVAARVGVELAVGEHVPGPGEDRVGDSGRGFGVAAARAEPLVLAAR